eukprot:CAMPEP_0176389800 /NCGR_PEP_ID=MMETSP0126-20121128/38671_1 /TAXON_ID=141414 ORGANISM="Strombidinopsis acuminatum, Strain SPMC142" /NCGR_SAMPLE_ID=MMETSP0126 /ASSEMBLY_ACC=CAM_ASM_000229 /LENGTH=46 /DNA_ID= /DNA_START= /DNA_END= /DNA_ORIENTATION=
MIYAPPSREKTKQTMRSPMKDKSKIVNNHPGSQDSAYTTMYQGSAP